MDVELQQKLLTTRAELQAVRARLVSAKQSRQLLDLTKARVQNEETNGRVWQGVGRMFMSVSTKQHEVDNASRAKELDEQVSSLQKKENYYATTLEKMLLALKTSD